MSALLLTLQKAEICTTNMSKFLSDLSYSFFFPSMQPLSFLLMAENTKFLFGDSLIKLLSWKVSLNYLKNQLVLALLLNVDIVNC